MKTGNASSDAWYVTPLVKRGYAVRRVLRISYGESLLLFETGICMLIIPDNADIFVRLSVMTPDILLPGLSFTNSLRSCF